MKRIHGLTRCRCTYKRRDNPRRLPAPDCPRCSGSGWDSSTADGCLHSEPEPCGSFEVDRVTGRGRIVIGGSTRRDSRGAEVEKMCRAGLES
jgi:hypothetical protein